MSDGAGEPAIRARALEKRFGPVTALHPLDLDVAPGATLAVLGPNGAGKSTLLRMLAGLARPTSGELRVAGDGDGRAARRRRVGLIGHATFLVPALTARENLRFAARLHGLADAEARAEHWLAELDLEGAADRRSGTFSRGMAQRLSIARALITEPALLLLDEPFTGLDPDAAERLASRLADADRRSGATTLLVTHDLARAAQLADQALVLARGRSHGLDEACLADATVLTGAYHDAVSALQGPRG